tara:strand:- start:9387 stop:10475 length:1089 start_codon:yes stop_codon:yes gene_type:complete
MSKFALNLPINSVSFGQISTAILKELKSRGEDPSIFLIGNPDLSTQKVDNEFNDWLNKRLNGNEVLKNHSRETPVFKLWHIRDSLSSFSNEQNLLTFYELDSPTPQELNIIKNQNKVFVTNDYTKQVFDTYGAKNVEKVPLFFDSHNFHKVDKKYFRDDRIVFNLCGKYENRKRHAKAIQAWTKRFGNDKRYYLQAAIYNVFLKKENVDHNVSIQNQILQGKDYFNVDFKPFYGSNAEYNDFLNSGDILLGVSGAEGWGLPEFHSVALGKHAVILNAHGYKEWANDENSTLINPSGKIEAYDNMFFHKGQPYNQGSIFDWNEDEFIGACEEAIKKFESNKINEKGLELKDKFTVSNTVNQLF